MSRSLKISGDTKELRKSLLDLAKNVQKDLGKSKIELFTPETKKMLRGEALTQAAAIKKQIDAIKESTKRHQQALQQVVRGSKEELAIREKILKASQHISKLEKDRSKSNELADQMKVPGFRDQFMKFSGLGAVMKGAGKFTGMGAAGMGGALLGGGLLAAGAYGMSRMMSARDTYTGGVDTRLKLRGRGVSDLDPTDVQGMTAAGLNSLTLRQARLRDMDVFGKEGASQKSVIQRAMFERNYGLEEGTMSGIAGQFRSSMGGKGANQTMMKLQASLIASGISDAIGPYLETAAQMLTELNERGFTMDESVTSLFNSMLKMGMGEGRIQKLAMGVDSGIRGSTGESNAFFQSIFNKAGIGGGTIGGAQAAMRMGGLFGVDLDKYKAMGGTDRKMFQTLGIGGANHMQNVAGATLGSLDQMFGSSSEIDKQLASKDKRTREGGALKRLSRLRYMMSSFGLKDEGQASEVEGLLKKAATASPAQQKKIMRQIQDIKENTPELINLKAINKSNEGIYNILQNEKQTLEDAMGETIAPILNKMQDLLNSIDGAILAIAKFLTGYETPAEREAAEKKSQVEQTQRGRSDADQFLKTGMFPVNGTRDITQGMPWEEQMDFGKKVRDKMNENKDGGLFRNRGYEQMWNSKDFQYIRKGIEGEERRRLREAGNGGGSSSVTSSGPLMTPISGNSAPSMDRTNSLLTRLARAGEQTARNTKERGTLKPSSGSTTGN